MALVIVSFCTIKLLVLFLVADVHLWRVRALFPLASSFFVLLFAFLSSRTARCLGPRTSYLKQPAALEPIPFVADTRAKALYRYG
jgi:hypothetical protein